jgi:hypothetical protein
MTVDYFLALRRAKCPLWVARLLNLAKHGEMLVIDENSAV